MLLTRLPYLAASALALMYGSALFSQTPPAGRGFAEVTVVAVDGFGSMLPNPIIEKCIDDRSHDRAALFHSGKGLIPPGRYRIPVHADGDFKPATFEVEVNAPRTLITASLEWYGVENLGVSGEFHGTLKGATIQSGDWCKASGLYSRKQYESRLDPSDDSFDFGSVPPGIYILTCTTKGRIVVLRSVRINASTLPFSLNAELLPEPLDSQAPK